MNVFFLSLFSLTFVFARPPALQLRKMTSFDSPVAMVSQSGLLFVVEQPGIIRYFEKSTPSKITTFLNIKAKVDGGGEKGLLGLAFHPKFKDNGLLYLNYTSFTKRQLKTIVSSWKADPKTFTVDLRSEKVLFTIDQPAPNHNGGTIVFGPDGALYIATGDGGFSGDPFHHSQNQKSLLGKILKLEVDKNSTPEIFAYGLRNPWKISFDRKTGKLWAADVGQNEWEEINIIEQGKNYGWRIKEGRHCYKPKTHCSQKGLTDPVFEYSHADGNCSITGGFVYRGDDLPYLKGNYIYGDFCSGKIWALNTITMANVQLLDSGLAISSFGEDAEGEIYVLDHASGAIFLLSKK